MSVDESEGFSSTFWHARSTDNNQVTFHHFESAEKVFSFPNLILS